MSIRIALCRALGRGVIEGYRCDLPEGWYEKLMGREKAANLRAKTAKMLGMTVKELVGE